jgi:radical SAM protein with 4Fe4S-binding SPASM domain
MNWNDPEGVNLSQQPPESLLNTEHFQHKKSACPFPFYTLVIHSDLRVSPCCVDWDKKAVVGDLKTDTLAAIWNGKRMLDFRLEHLRGNRQNLEACARCTYLYTVPDSVDTLTPSAYLSRRL